MPESIVGRRRFLKGASAATLAAAGAVLLDACGGSDAAPGGPASTARSIGEPTSGPGAATTADLLPVEEPFVAVEPDLPALDSGVPAAYLAYPADPPQMFDQPPLDGGAVSVLKIGDLGLPATLGQNPWWQELNKRVGAEMKINQIQSSDYNSKLATALAGGGLPDIVQLKPSYPRLPDVLEAKFQDLSPWLSGDKIKNYPCLAAIPTTSWKNVTIGGGLWGIPWPFGLAGSTLRARGDIFEKLGLEPKFSDGEEFLALCQELTSVKDHRWALNRIAGAVQLVGEMVGAPNDWREEGGEFTRNYETDEYKEMLGIVREIWKKGYIYPDSLASTAGYEQWFINGASAMMYDAYTNWSGIANRALTVKGFHQVGMIAPKWDGSGQAGHFLNKGIYTFTALKKADPARIEEILTALNWFASPWGSAEHLFLRHGIAGRHYNLEGTDPVETPTGSIECQQMQITYLATGPSPLYMPGQPDLTKDLYGYLGELMKEVVPHPTVGLYSDSELTVGATLSNNIVSLRNDIIAGRKPLSAWDAGVKAWRTGGGDKIREEYEQSFAAAS